MIKLYCILLVLLTTTILADSNSFLIQQNSANLTVCKKYFTDEKFVKTVNLLNGYQMILRDIPDTLDKDGNEPYSQLNYTVIDCLFEGKYLIVDEFIPDSHSYFAIDLRDGEITNIDGITLLSPDRKHFLTTYTETEEPSYLYKVSIYSINNNKIKKVFTQKFDFGTCTISNIKWINDNKISFDISCEYNENKTKAYLEYYKKKWRFIELRRNARD